MIRTFIAATLAVFGIVSAAAAEEKKDTALQLSGVATCQIVSVGICNDGGCRRQDKMPGVSLIIDFDKKSMCAARDGKCLKSSKFTVSQMGSFNKLVSLERTMIVRIRGDGTLIGAEVEGSNIYNYFARCRR